MEQPNQDIYNKFNDLIKRLPADERQKLYDRLKVMSPEERNQAVVKLVEHFYPSVKKAGAAPVKAPAPANSPAPNMRQAQAPKPQSVKPQVVNPEPARAPKEEVVFGNNDVSNMNITSSSITAEDFETPSKKNETNTKPKKRLKKNVKKAMIASIITFVAIIVIGVLGLEAYWHKDQVKAWFNPSETTEETAVSSEVPASEEVATSETVLETSMETEAVPTEVPGPTNVPVLPGAPDLTGLVIVLDPGHQEVADDSAELCAPWLSISKPRCTAGATGSVTGVPEYELTLQYCLIMQNYLQQCGATVYLTRETNDVNMSNQERANFAVMHEADVFIRVHCDSSEDSGYTGVRVYVPDTGDLSASDVEWGNVLGTLVADAEGLEFDSAVPTYLYTGLNYANTLPAFQISLGFLTNSENEAVLLDPDNEIRVAEVIAEFCSNFL